MFNKPALLALGDGTLLEGVSIGAPGEATGELVFNTAMTGYQEILTDPSYARQLVTLTTAHVGNTGCNMEDMESSRIWAAGLIIRDCSILSSNYRSEWSLPEWLKKNHMVAISGIDTRWLTLHLRDKGAMGACISTHFDKPESALSKAKAFPGLQGADLAGEVSRKTIERWHEGRGSWAEKTRELKYHVVAYDFGIKHTMLRILHDLGCHITLVPARTSAKEVMALNPDGILLSNGPGDPAACGEAIAATSTFLEKGIPLFGICLGFQILALAAGAKTIKMKFGHHGANHPVIETAESGRVFITSQNHGFTIDENSMPDFLEVTHRSLFDGTLQGIRHKNKPAYAFQGHPESSPGPHDIEGVFEPFVSLMRSHKENL